MLKYSFSRMARSMISLFIIITVVFILLRQMPIEGYFPDYDNMTPEAIHNALENMGLNDPITVQLARFYKTLLKGDLGLSARYRVNYPIVKLFAAKAPLSLAFGGTAMLMSLPLGLLLGALMAWRKGKILDKLGTVYIVLMQSVPLAVTYLIIQLVFTSIFKIPMLYSSHNPRTWVLPVLTLGLPTISNYALWMRRYMVDESNRDYILLARAKGMPGSTIWFKHIFRNAIVPLVQLIPTSLLATLSGSIYVESLYSIPGMGGLLVDAIKRQDNPMVQALVVIFAAVSILGLLFGDLLMGIVDPRISLSKKEGAR
ncbi:MAG: ABC transporter permease [Bacillota bacterium]|jgi:oligopeptide transport system permease protein